MARKGGDGEKRGRGKHKSARKAKTNPQHYEYSAPRRTAMDNQFIILSNSVATFRTNLEQFEKFPIGL